MLLRPVFEARDIAEHRQGLIKMYQVWNEVSSKSKTQLNELDMDFTFQALNELLDRATWPTVWKEPEQ